MSLEMGDLSKELHALVLERQNEPIILGMPFIKENVGSIDIITNKINFLQNGKDDRMSQIIEDYKTRIKTLPAKNIHHKIDIESNTAPIFHKRAGSRVD